MIVMTAVCDLEQDFTVRFPEEQQLQDYQAIEINDDDPAILPHVLLCEAFSREHIRPRIRGSDLWKRIRQNQDERFHCLKASSEILPELYSDFKKSLAIPTSILYEGLRASKVERLGVVPSIYLHDLIQQFFSFMARVGLPE